MIIKNITKLVVAIVLTLAVTFGSSTVDVEVGLLEAPSAYACGGTGSGGGC